jgi:hypothetical protein
MSINYTPRGGSPKGMKRNPGAKTIPEGEIKKSGLYLTFRD